MFVVSLLRFNLFMEKFRFFFQLWYQLLCARIECCEKKTDLIMVAILLRTQNKANSKNHNHTVYFYTHAVVSLWFPSPKDLFSFVREKGVLIFFPSIDEMKEVVDVPYRECIAPRVGKESFDVSLYNIHV